jgi:HSP20 family protein
MTTMIRYEPWALFNELSRALHQNPERTSASDASSAATADWAPAVDIAEYADRFVLTADVPGVEPSSIEVTLDKGVLTLAGSREKPVDAVDVERKRSERATGRFHRRFSLPDTVDSESVSARNTNGVLEVVIPKRPAAQPRKIAVTH